MYNNDDSVVYGGSCLMPLSCQGGWKTRPTPLIKQKHSKKVQYFMLTSGQGPQSRKKNPLQKILDTHGPGLQITQMFVFLPCVNAKPHYPRVFIVCIM